MDFSLGGVLMGTGGLLVGVGALVAFLKLAELLEAKTKKQESEE